MDERQLQDRQLVEKEMTNHELRKSVRGHHFQVLAAQSAVCELTVRPPRVSCRMRERLTPVSNRCDF